MISLSSSLAGAIAVSHFLGVHAVTLPNFRFADTVQRFSLRPVPKDSIQRAVSNMRSFYVDDKYGRSARGNSVFERWTDFMSQMLFICPLQNAMDALSANGPVFGFDINDPNFLPWMPEYQNIHGVDLFYFWLQDSSDPWMTVAFSDPRSLALRKRMRQ
jgi:hypothetical protein